MTGNEAATGGPKRYVVIHGHFYQPPRENSWLGIIEKQDSASPDHDWNERIYDQCYRPNAFSRILDPRGMIVDIHNNYLYLSHNFGPTLFRWLETNHPKVAQRIVEADRESYLRFKKHGNALAQVYNHLIMPLASRRDQITQIRWAKEFFRGRYGRECEGFWLAETAINMETVRCLVEEGVRFVVLSPAQADSFRALDGKEPWKKAEGGIDTRRAYRVFPRTPDGNRLDGHLDVFFFDEGLSREISFGDLLINANTLGQRIRGCYDDNAAGDQLVVIATDGETFGHHKPFGDMCLAYFFNRVAAEMNIEPVNFGYYLEKNPPAFEVMLKNEFGEGTAWSCAHGVGRWTRDCGCKAGGPRTWNQVWRGPLRLAFETLQRHVDETFEKTLRSLAIDPWKLRDCYQRLADARSLREFKALLAKEGGVNADCSDEDAMTIRRLLEAQKYMLFSYTSCGWFFSDVSGIETVQNIAYAARALQLGVDSRNRDCVTAEFVLLLSEAKSNIPEKDGAAIFRESALPFLHHLEILSFAQIAEKSVDPGLSDTLEFTRYGYRLAIAEHPHPPGPPPKKCEVWIVSIDNPETGEHGRFAIRLKRTGGQLRGWCISAGALDAPGFDAYTPDGFAGHPGCVTLDLSQLFEESRVRLAAHFLRRMSDDTRRKYASWMDLHEKSLDSLSNLGVPLPSFVAAPIAYVLTARWNAIVNEIEIYGREDDVWTRLIDLWKKTQTYDIALDYSESARLLLDLLIAELKIFAETLSEVSVERMRFILNIVDRFKIPFSKNKPEDLFFSVLEKTLVPLYDDFKKTPESRHRETVIRLVQFARRMNFNTDSYPVV